MAKYKPLTIEELKLLEKEFVNFLVLNGIIGDDWVKMKKESPESAEEMTELFSDVIWEGVLRNAKYLDFKSAYSIKCFHCQEDKIVLVGVDSSITDMSNVVFDSFDGDNIPSDLEVYTTEKKYNKARELEIYDMLNWGCEISDGSLYKRLCVAI